MAIIKAIKLPEKVRRQFAEAGRRGGLKGSSRVKSNSGRKGGETRRQQCQKRIDDAWQSYLQANADEAPSLLLSRNQFIKKNFPRTKLN